MAVQFDEDEFTSGVGFLSFLKSKKAKTSQVGDLPSRVPLAVDLGRFKVGSSSLGELPDNDDFFSQVLHRSDVYEDPIHGVELGVENRVLGYAFISVTEFDGRFLKNGEPTEISKNSLEADVRACFGEPYWIDRSDGEVILFYEYAGGSVELQFEFPDAESLGFVTMTRNGVLSTAEQRKSYGVDKPWPPES